MLVEIVDGVHERARHIADVDVVALEVGLEQHDGAIGHRAIDEIVDQQVDAHARRHAEHGRQPEADRVPAIEHDLLGLHLVAAVERDRAQRRLLGAELALLADAVAAVGGRHDDALLAATAACSSVAMASRLVVVAPIGSLLQSGAPTSAASGMMTSAFASSGLSVSVDARRR